MADIREKRLVDLSHVIEAGMTTHRGLPGPQICDFWTREASAANYDDGSTFQIGRIDMIANTGTYVDSPFHRYADGCDLAGLELDQLAGLDGIVVRRPFENGLATDAKDLRGIGTCVGGPCWSIPDGIGIGGPTLICGSSIPDRSGGALAGRAWRDSSSASTATISTIHADGRARCTASCFAPEFRLASI